MQRIRPDREDEGVRVRAVNDARTDAVLATQLRGLETVHAVDNA